MGVFNDEFDGIGGSYVMGKDGKRTRVPEDGESAPAAQPAAQPAPAAVNEPAKEAEQPTNGDIDHVL